MTGIPTLDADTCPVCKSDRYLNPTMKLLPVFTGRIFDSKKQQFVAQTFEDLYVEKEVQVRKRIARIYNKRLEDFKNNLKLYNDYLENVEEILFNLINEVDVKETEERIKKYETEHKELINANLQKQLIEERRVQGRLDREKREKVIRKETYEQAVIEEAKVKKQAKDDIIKRLAEEDTLATDVIAEAHARRPQAPDIDKLLEARLPHNGDEAAADYMEYDEADATPFDPMDHTYEIVSYTTIRDFYSDPWQKHLRLDEEARGNAARASGYAPKFVYERAITSAFAGIFAGI
ncbi:hypothetical protein PhCBS80983_g01012 [Powellomyces hirtus]|uniref:Uncharacterized protein n=1 Tax=Powellomyces hirtus TaxID=109895 RepID=A0A507EEN7_9FUNG|nr:hypothetical protein PhCBS80983_g01012 [Powellomyces hirtus]